MIVERHSEPEYYELIIYGGHSLIAVVSCWNLSKSLQGGEGSFLGQSHIKAELNNKIIKWNRWWNLPIIGI